MFRKPRDSVAPEAIETPIRPSTGRPPTPPSSIGQPSQQATAVTTYSLDASNMTPLLGRSKTLPKKTLLAAVGKTKGKGGGNGNIMNFFKKAESQGAEEARIKEEENSLFLEEKPSKIQKDGPLQTPTPPRDEIFPDEMDFTREESPSPRFNEDMMPSKRRKVEENTATASKPPDSKLLNNHPRGPFADDSEDEGINGSEADYFDGGLERDRDSKKGKLSLDEVEVDHADTATIDVSKETPNRNKTGDVSTTNSPSNEKLEIRNAMILPPTQLKRENTSIGEVNDFDGIEDFINDEFAEDGEEYLERKWMEEQGDLDMLSEDEDQDLQDNLDRSTGEAEEPGLAVPNDVEASNCPICGGSTAGLAEEQISVHVNECLDGKAKPLPSRNDPSKDSKQAQVKQEPPVPAHKRFQRAAIARPGQDNPFGLAGGPPSSSSAFSKLMSGHAEDAAWATAAASEQQSRGKPAYQRTCPFYKIMPGLFICVDAFRYGAVAGCNAYFLSHFHSDHYIGLTSSWCHGPIYCSHVTANLVRQQLRVDPKWVVDLEFDKKAEVPNTQGVDVTMIPANHCPGSSLFLFEKVIGKGRNPKIQRILHCGDFRACPAHVQHPKLRPDIIDTVTKRNIAQQKLDVCYLDTTYLTPKYAFPSQEDVIKACADMCVSLSKDFVDENDSWEQTKKERAGDGMVKFVRKTSIKEEPSNDDDIQIKREDDDNTNIKSEYPSPTPNNKKPRGRLLVIIGTYSIGKERICLGVARALNSKIYAPPSKQRICAALCDAELTSRLTTDPLEAQVHMQMLMEIRAETLADYLTGFKPHFSRVVGFRPSGWNYRPPVGRFMESPSVGTVLHGGNWKSGYSMRELVPQRGSTREASCFGVPYSEHSSFRELTMFVCALRIDKIVPTVNVGSARSRERMKGWVEKWGAEKKRNGLFRVEEGQREW
ncbi:DNA cross-link repair protein PSO2/SNM1 [Lecanora helva]